MYGFKGGVGGERGVAETRLDGTGLEGFGWWHHDMCANKSDERSLVRREGGVGSREGCEVMSWMIGLGLVSATPPSWLGFLCGLCEFFLSRCSGGKSVHVRSIYVAILLTSPCRPVENRTTIKLHAATVKFEYTELTESTLLYLDKVLSEVKDYMYGEEGKEGRALNCSVTRTANPVICYTLWRKEM